MSRRTILLLTLLAGLLPAAPAAAQPDGHRHQSFLFQIRHSPELNRSFVYRAFRTEPGNPDGYLIERGNGWLGDARHADLRPTACPALGRALRALADLPPPAVFLGEQEAYDISAAHGEEYSFGGFVHFANGGEGEVSFMAYDVPDRRPDAQLEWMRTFVRAFDACVPRTGTGGSG